MSSRVKGRMQILPDVSGLNDSDCKFKLVGVYTRFDVSKPALAYNKKLIDKLLYETK